MTLEYNKLAIILSDDVLKARVLKLFGGCQSVIDEIKRDLDLIEKHDVKPDPFYYLNIQGDGDKAE